MKTHVQNNNMYVVSVQRHLKMGMNWQSACQHMHNKRKTPSLPECTFCKHTYISQMNLEIHQEVYDGPHVCKICNKTFPSKFNLHQYYNSCHQKFNCEVCGYRFLSKQALKEHVVREHNSQEQFPFSQCKDIFYSQNARLAHVAEHHQDIFKS